MLQPLSTRFIQAALSLALLGTGISTYAATPITTCGFIINAPGTYNLASDLGPCTSSSGINIQASNVTVNFNGHKVSGGGPAWVGININPTFTANPLTAPRLSGISIYGPGLIQLFAGGIQINGTDNIKIDHITSTRHLDGIGGSGFTNVALTNDVFSGNRKLGINFISVKNADILDNDVSGNGYTKFFPGVITGGILLSNGTNNEVRQNTVNGNNNVGIYLEGEAGANVQNNTVNGNQTIGILLYNGTQSVILYNTSEGNMSLDMSETSANCGTNRWQNNTFYTSDQTCIH